MTCCIRHAIRDLQRDIARIHDKETLTPAQRMCLVRALHNLHEALKAAEAVPA